MSPSQLSWLQGCLFLFLGLAGGYGLNWCQNRRTNHGTSDVELGSIVVDNGTSPPPSDDADPSGGDEEARSPSNFSNPVGEAMAFTGARRCLDRNGLRSKSRGRSRRLLQPSAETRKKSSFLEFVAKTAAPNFARRETAYSIIVASRTSSPMSSPTEGLLRLSGGEDEALSPSHPVRKVLASPGTPSYPDRKRWRSDSCRRMNAPEKRTKSPFENFTAKDEARIVGRPEPANMVVAGSSSTSMASKTAVLPRPPRRHFVPRPSLEIPLVDRVQVRTSDGLRFRPRGLQEPSGEEKRFRGVRYRADRRIWVAEMKPPKSKHKSDFGAFKSQLQAACAIDAAFFYYNRPDRTNFLHSTPAMMAMLTPIPTGLDDKDQIRTFVKDKAKRLAMYAADILAGVTPSLDKINQ